MADSGNIKVVVRCRPMNSRERTRGASNLIEVVDQHQLVLHPPLDTDARESAKATKKKTMPFSFDRAYDEQTEQRTLFEYVGLDLLEHSFNGFNTCVFAYGQTGSGKSHSMVGYAEAKGLIPLTCSKLFDDADRMMAKDPHLRIRVEVSYIEIYNEKVRDLLNPANKGNLKVREHPSMGPYVEDLSKLVVSTFKEVENLMDEGNKARTVAATNMNETSSRSHAVFTLVLSQRRKDEQTGLEAEKVSRISLIDLAGSERANATGATGSRLKEGANINKSLTSLGKVIAALAQASMSDAQRTPRKRGVVVEHIPYRDSVLTWLLKDSLGGNSKTAMIAAISPADYEETLSTLRYADQAKKIKNKAVVNEDPNAKLIRELKEELEMLRQRAAGGTSGMVDEWDPSVSAAKQIVRYRTKTGEIKSVTQAELQEQMEQSEKLMSSLNESWEEKLQRTHAIQVEREKALEELGITIDKGNVGVHTPKNMPHLVNLNEDALMNECLLYQLKPGLTVVGNVDSTSSSAHIRLSGNKILPEHCTFENIDGVVTLYAKQDSMTMVNGKRISHDQPKRLRSGYRVILGDFHVFRVNNPGEVRKARDRVTSAMTLANGSAGGPPGSPARPDSPASEDGQYVDWTYARREAIINHLHGQDVGLDHLSNEDLDRLFDDINRARTRKGTPGLSRPHSRVSSSNSEALSSLARPYSTNTFTDDTSLDPWGDPSEDYSASPAVDVLVDVDADAGTSLDAAVEDNSIVFNDSAAEAELLRAKVKKYEERILKLDPNGMFQIDDEPFTDEQRTLLVKIIRSWQTKTGVSMAEDVLANAALLKEGNIIAKELGKRTTYQFTIVESPPLSNPTSSIESIAGLSDYDDVVDADLAAGPKPCVAIKVLDFEHNSVYIWSIPKFCQDRLRKMRNLYTFIDKPVYSQHFNLADPFYESPPPIYSFFGACLVPLRPLTQRRSAKYRLPIFCTHSDSTVGQCSVEVKFIGLTPPPAQSSYGNAKHKIPVASNKGLTIGYKLNLQLAVDSVDGLSPEHASAAHIQVRLSSLVGPSIERDDSFASAVVSLQSPTDLKDIKLRKTVALILTEDIVTHLTDGYASVEFHVKATPPYLDHLAELDARRAAKTENVSTPVDWRNPPKADDLDGRPDLRHGPPSQGRLAEQELISEQRHDVLATLRLCELDASGDYQPVQVRYNSGLDPGVFMLRQGLQRKLLVRLTHDSGTQLNWSRISKIHLGQIRLLDSKGRTLDAASTSTVQLNVPGKQQNLELQTNGTSLLSAWAWWDTSAHDCVFLNKVTPSENRIVVRLTMDVEAESCASPISFSMDLAISIKARDAKSRGRLMTMIETATTDVRTLQQTYGVFAVRLTPPQVLKSKELWRLNTAGKYVRGQEALGDWKPLGVGFISEHKKFMKRQRRRVENEGWRAMLSESHQRKELSTDRSPESEKALLTKVVNLWRSGSQQDTSDEATTHSLLRLALHAAEEGDKETPSSSSAPSAPNRLPHTMLSATATLLPRSDAAAKKGYLMMPLDALSDSWTKRYCVLKRPHLFLYSDSRELEPLVVIHLGTSAVRVEADQSIEKLLERKGVFGLYTASNSYFLQAPNQGERDSWIAALHGVRKL